MSQSGKSRLSEILIKNETDLLANWQSEQKAQLVRKGMSVLKESELRGQCKEFLNLLLEAMQSAESDDIQAAAWASVRGFLNDLSRSWGLQGYSPSETASFIFSAKKPIFTLLRKELAKEPQAIADETQWSSDLLDKLGLFTTEAYQKTREEVIIRQQQEMLELSTPVVKLWEGILALPMIGTLDSSRTQVVMESLLQKIVETGSAIAIIDITGVPMVDTLTAQHLLKTVTAARLMGAECIISGIRPQIAQTIVHLGVDLGDVATKATLADAFAMALHRSGRMVTRIQNRAQA